MIAALANHLWQSTLCAALAGLLVLGLAKDCARVRYWVWLGASWKFGVPLCLLMSLGGQFGWRTATTDASQEHLSVVKQVAQPFVTQPPLLIVPASVPVAAHPLTGVLAALWSCGCLGSARRGRAGGGAFGLPSNQPPRYRWTWVFRSFQCPRWSNPQSLAFSDRSYCCPRALETH